MKITDPSFSGTSVLSGSFKVSGSILLNGEQVTVPFVPTITTVYPLTVKESDESYTIEITGSRFDGNAEGYLVGTDGNQALPTTSTRISDTNMKLFYSSSARLTGNLEPYDTVVVNSNGENATVINNISVNDSPLWITEAGRLGTIYAGTSLTASFFISASDEEGAYPISYSLEVGTLPQGLTFLTGSGEITGSSTIGLDTGSYNQSGVQSNLTFKATDNDGVFATRNFNILKKWIDGSTELLAFDSTTEAVNLGVSQGLYWFKNSIGETQQLYYYDGYILVASNNAGNATFPTGTGRNNLAYTLTRNGTSGALGTPSPDSDYLIGDFLTNFNFSGVRGIGFGYNSTDGTYSFSNLGEYLDVSWNTTSLTSVTNINSITVTGNSSLASLAIYGVVDAVLMDTSLNANSDQSTIGIAIVANSNGDPSNGCYYGHGNGENNNSEGWYNSSSVAYDSQGYTTWLKS